MKKQNLLILWLCVLYTTAFAQVNQIKIVSHQVKSTLPANVEEWTSIPGAIVFTAQKNPSAQVREPRIVVQIRSAGAVVCGNNQATALSLPPFDVKTFTANDLAGILSSCRELKEGSYQLCVQFFNIDRVAISNEVCKEFRVEGKKTEDYAPPTLITPENGKVFTPADMKKPLQFRWTPVVPKPKEPVLYKLKVWQLMQGQNAVSAIKSNTPVAEKEVREVTQTIINNIYNGPCLPPYLCDFVWQVQALTREGKPLGKNNGNSEVFSFKVSNNIDIQIDSLTVDCCKEGKQNIYIKVKNNLTSPVNIVAVKYKINGVGASINLTPITPALPQFLAGSSTIVFTSKINCIDTANFLKFLIDAEDVADPDNKETEVKSDTLHCACNVCDEKHFVFNAPKPSISFSQNIINFNQPLLITTSPSKPIKSIAAEIVYFEMIPENDFCIPCNKTAMAYGHFTNGSNTQQWSGTANNINIAITTPQLTPCCSAHFRWCIRYKIEFTDCTSCTRLICYEMKKEGCSNTGQEK